MDNAIMRNDRPRYDRTMGERDQHRMKIARLYLHGKRVDEIASTLDMPIEYVTRDLATIRAAWLESALRDFNQSVAEELAKINDIEAELWGAWMDSRKTREIVRREKREGAQGMRGPSAIGVVTTEERTPNIEYMKGIQWCVDRRIKLLGLDAPPRQNNPIADAMKPYNPNVNKGRVIELLNVFATRIAEAAGESDAGDDRIISGIATER